MGEGEEEAGELVDGEGGAIYGCTDGAGAMYLERRLLEILVVRWGVGGGGGDGGSSSSGNSGEIGRAHV